MDSKRKIKVIKKSDLATERRPPVEDRISEKMRNYDMSSKVSEWIGEFRQRRSEELMFGLDQILTD